MSDQSNNPIVIKFIYSPYRRDRGKKRNIKPVEMNPYWVDSFNQMFKNW